MRSIRRELVGWLSIGLLFAVVVAGVGTYLRARDEANALFDYQLQETAASLTGAPFTTGAAPGAGNAAGTGAIVVQIWDRSGVQVYLSQPQRDLPRYAQLGFATISTGHGDWRVFSTICGRPGRAGRAARQHPARARRQHGAAHDHAASCRRAVPRLARLVHDRARIAAARPRRRCRRRAHSGAARAARRDGAAARGATAGSRAERPPRPPRARARGAARVHRRCRA